MPRSRKAKALLLFDIVMFVLMMVGVGACLASHNNIGFLVFSICALIWFTGIVLEV